ncbi:MAG: MoaD/ThiS family protein [Deltaproteobacteria bacterium]|nr:MoaD/ThiS family protein [Deltaproteobacteria bacterium]
MKIHLRFFATLCNRFGTGEQEIEIEAPQEAREIFRSLFEDRNLADRMIRFVRFAVNCEYVSPETLVHDGDELAFIPPVSGG